VNKTELIEHIAKHADISKAAATRALESMIGAVKTRFPSSVRARRSRMR
jgi:DNA-binding protein HU-beta